ncbi:bifunctional N(6)-L-threonylcarbamoyladenine synthase/serine/threonine protein kinase [Candidatus Woesearchaeota archaeon]|nr:bifunctional N(6)-L-threonylcarbamoyladenine synthase/serine/threonine protein kinase [Candidatus Woesearchaeota archaeon]HIH37392.1 bifunctional N(6)-L-threonylcarbamoyladenine synthase/serine/threonine protein kinase [Candidatus Woesearchaeota archaeon]HIH48387.1 bifunctional N(6)-L-threonylcarbamoyladenine synthase/serine/threonine protein kinase [Candidatus Woesearchaeota archaeon]HIJ04232.1 bifunctional N(6)-L-threonylcarbamoyladenine synthase/serine/threonine protein kinase [Candidatus 
MICLGIESTAHTFGVGVIDKKKHILANIRKMYVTESGGIIPIAAAKQHEQHADALIKQALADAKLKIQDIDLIAFSQGPGLGPCLRVGMNTAKELHNNYSIPCIGVNHCIAHLEIAKALTKAKDPVLLYTSGANTQVIAFESGKYRVFGETLDNGVGNFIDGIARYLGLGFPGGPKIEEIAKKGKKYIELPYVVKGMDVSFGGLQTNIKHKIDKQEFKIEDLMFSMQETVFAMLLEVAERALFHCEKKELVIGGGVACNKRLQEMCEEMCRENKFRFYCPNRPFLIDNGVMIAWLGINMATKNAKLNEFSIHPYERTDDVDVYWAR